MSLSEYQAKRDFRRTSEPKGRVRRAADGWKVHDLIGDAALPLALDGQPFALADIYEGVYALGSRPAAAVAPSSRSADSSGRGDLGAGTR